MRAFLVLLHRYIGLATALFLLMAGLTGSILAFNHELDEWLNPGVLYSVCRRSAFAARHFGRQAASGASEATSLVHGVPVRTGSYRIAGCGTA